MKTYLLCLLLACAAITHCQSCIGANGRLVDWWIVLKTPKNVAYGYFDSIMESKSTSFTVNNAAFTTPTGPVTRTLLQINSIYGMETVAWSDQPPNGNAGSSYAHAKGLIAFSRTANKGFSIQHSLPQFPEFFGNKSINPINRPNSNTYGQTILCQSLGLSGLNTLAAKYQTVKPFVYFTSVKLAGNAQTSGLEQLSKRDTRPIKQPHALSYLNYKNGNTQIKAIFKAASYNTSIFGDSAPKAEGLTSMLGSSIYVQSWRGDDGSFCNLQSSLPDNVMYINSVKLGNISWTRTADHSKWVVSVDGQWSCVGGMNRQVSQWSRGGQFICIKSRNLNKAFSSLITSKDSCGAQSPLRRSKSLNFGHVNHRQPLRRRNSYRY